ncbi:MAG TPA: MOSC domain-containing protein [Conexibacter sp.]|nr:MOSC domain-containing protein [Conexibacter sp.]
MSARIAWISFTPVKGLRVQELREAELTGTGIVGDRAFLLVDATGAMANGKRHGALLAVVAEHDAAEGRLTLRFPDGRVVEDAIELGAPEDVGFYRGALRVRPVAGPFSAALSEHAGAALRLVAAPGGRDGVSGVDRGRDGAVTLLSRASLERLRVQSGDAVPVDPRRFRMNIGIEGVEAHAEDGWLGRTLRIGTALVRVTGHVGRCAVTTRNAESGVVDFPTLHHLEAYRGAAAQPDATERLPFGVHARVLEAGRVRVGDAVILA